MLWVFIRITSLGEAILMITNNIDFVVRPTIKNCWFAVLLPTHPKQALPKKNYCLSEDFFFFGIFFSNFVNKKYF